MRGRVHEMGEGGVFGTIKQEDLDHLMYLVILMGTVTFLSLSYIGLLVLQCVADKWYGRHRPHEIPRVSAAFNETECVLQEVSKRRSRAIRQSRRESWYFDNVGSSSDRQAVIPHDNHHSDEQNHGNGCEASTENESQADRSFCINFSRSSTGNRESLLLPVSGGSWLSEGIWENNELYVDHDLHGQSETVM
ncbi:uncharacterized protein [Haliotis asinina]|uniref:uncharacterized protein n=1 Tax=Haliotis asinina TaxID=109174 RepID=UPI003531F65A